MNSLDLRTKYPVFIFKKFSSEISGNHLRIEFYYSIPPDHSFIHQLNFDFPTAVNPPSDELILALGLSLIPSYWKSVCSPVIEIQAGNLTPDQIRFWEKLFIRGMGEYFYKNQIDFTGNGFISVKNGQQVETPPATKPLQQPDGKPRQIKIPDPNGREVLIPVGGGKDSAVTLELLKPHFQITPFVINPVPVISDVLKVAAVKSPIIVRSQIDPRLLELNRLGYLNGHVPVSAFYSFCSVLAAAAAGIPFVAFSNESSSNEGNTSYLGREINHQYSKTLEFESDLNLYLQSVSPADEPLSQVRCFSFLRPVSELQITKIFSRYPRYFPVFSSCNQNFKLDKKDPGFDKNTGHAAWCTRCPKCVSTALMLACFIGKEKVSEIMGVFPPDLPENHNLLDDLLGRNPVKPFECVLTRAEAAAAWKYVSQNQSSLLETALSGWQDNPNLPENFAVILKKSL